MTKKRVEPILRGAKTMPRRTIKAKKSISSDQKVRLNTKTMVWYEQIIAWLVEGKPVGLIVQSIVKGAFGEDISAFQAKKMVRGAFLYNQKVAKESGEFDSKRALHVRRLEDLYSMAYERKDIANARQTLIEIAKVEGFNAPEKVDHTTKGKEIKPQQNLVLSAKESPLLQKIIDKYGSNYNTSIFGKSTSVSKRETSAT